VLTNTEKKKLARVEGSRRGKLGSSHRKKRKGPCLTGGEGGEMSKRARRGRFSIEKRESVVLRKGRSR